MTRNDFFILCVERASKPLDTSVALDLLDFAASLPEDVYGELTPGTAAKQLAHWFSMGKPPKKKPEWLAKFDQAMDDRMLVRVNPDAHAHAWWDHAEIAFEDARRGVGPILPASCVPLITQGDASDVVVSSQDARLFKAWVENIPGHEDRPFLFQTRVVPT